MVELGWGQQVNKDLEGSRVVAGFTQQPVEGWFGAVNPQERRQEDGLELLM